MVGAPGICTSMACCSLDKAAMRCSCVVDTDGCCACLARDSAIPFPQHCRCQMPPAPPQDVDGFHPLNIGALAMRGCVPAVGVARHGCLKSLASSCVRVLAQWCVCRCSLDQVLHQMVLPSLPPLAAATRCLCRAHPRAAWSCSSAAACRCDCASPAWAGAQAGNAAEA